MDKLNVRVEYDMKPIRHLAIQCPSCKGWFESNDILDDDIKYSDDLNNIEGECPRCGEEFWFCSGKIEIEECLSSGKVHRDTLKKKIEWI